MDLKLMLLDVVVNSGIFSPEQVDYAKLGLFPKQYYTKGVITRTEYYFSYVNPTFSDLYVRINYAYTLTGTLYTSRIVTTEFIDTTEAIGYQTVHTENLTIQESFELEHAARENILGLAKEYALTTLGLTDYYDLMETCAVNVGLYVEGPYLPLTDQITALIGVKPYVDAPFAAAINAILSDI